MGGERHSTARDTAGSVLEDVPMRLLRALLFCLVGLTGAASAAAGGSCALRVSDPSGLASPWPLVGGLPLPQGALRDASRIRVLDAGGREVPAQVDTAATYRDGSIRWALVTLVGPPKGGYRAEFGGQPRRAPARGIALQRQGGTLRIDTGAALFTLSPANLLPESAALAGAQPARLWGPGESAAYLVDNQGRTARCAGGKAEISLTLLKSGPLRVVARTEGWYVTDAGERVARGIARLSFFAGTALVQVSHTLVFTEDTNKVWVRDYGLHIPYKAGAAARATFDTSTAFDGQAQAVSLGAGEAASLLQDDYPHFAETGSHFSLSVLGEGKTRDVLSGAACGEWCDLSSSRAGVTVVVRDLAEQFPKELEASGEGIRVHLWPARCGREWDFRAKTLMDQYWGEWARQGVWTQLNYSNRSAAMAEMPSNAQGAAKTHEVWLMLHPGPADVPATVKRAHAVCRPPLLQADPAFLCSTGAMTWPLAPKDEKRFPTEEAVISDYFDRIVLPYRVFPMTGVIQWGCAPYLGYGHKVNGRWVADFYRTAWSVEYGVRRHVWSLYARSGERKYYEYASRFGDFCADWDMAHWTAGDVVRGGFAYNYGRIHEPFFWRGPKSLLQIDNSGHDVAHWLLEYYLTGNERALEATREYGDALKAAWNAEEAGKSYAQFVLLRVLSALATREWDPAYRQMADGLAAQVIDLKQPNGLSLELNRPYGPLYKVDRSALALYDYWWATGSDAAKQAFLKAMDYQYRFNHIPPPVSYQNAGAYLFTIAHAWTGSEEYRRVAAQMVRAGLDVERVRLADELAGVEDLNALKTLPYRGSHTNMHFLLGMPTALTVAGAGAAPVPPWPLVARRGYPTEQCFALLEKMPGKALSFRLFADRLQPGDLSLRILGPDGKPAPAEIRAEARLPYRDWETGQTGPREVPVSTHVSLPAGAPPGAYRVSPEGPGTFVVLDATTDRAALLCPEGFWMDMETPAVYFRVPPGVSEARLFITYPVTVCRPDGTVALEAANEHIGEVAIPVGVHAGVWSLRWTLPGEPPPLPIRPHIRLLNLPPVMALAPNRLPRDLPPPSAAPPPAGLAPSREPALSFVEGAVGQALRLGGGKTIRFPRGEKLPEGGFAHFPAAEGTIELWFRPEWSSAWLALGQGQAHSFPFVRGGSVDFTYRYGAGSWRGNLYPNIDLLARGRQGAPGQEKAGDTGGMARHFFRVGEWVHLAATWRLHEGKTGTEGDFTVFLNGRKQARSWPWPFPLSGKEPFRLQEPAAEVTIGCPEGAMDELRISRGIRYEGDFEPERRPFAPDDRTTALFHFDGDTRGVAGAAAAPVDAR